MAEENSKTPSVITIDGPAGSGKSTVSRKLATKLGYAHLNSGALFRAVGIAGINRGIELDDDSALASLAEELEFDFRVQSDGSTSFFVNNEDWSAKVLTAEAGEYASRVGVLPKLREVLLVVQRDIAKRGPIVVEGRDSGSVVFPNADLKIYLDATPKERARRRWKELSERYGSDNAPNLAEIEQAISTRDHRDSTREHAPSCKPADAHHIDTTNYNIDQVVEKICEIMGS